MLKISGALAVCLAVCGCGSDAQFERNNASITAQLNDIADNSADNPAYNVADDTEGRVDAPLGEVEMGRRIRESATVAPRR